MKSEYLNEIIQEFNNSYKDTSQEDEKLRQEFIKLFPLDKLDTLELEKYALGKEPNNMCWWLEFNTIPIGSIKGGTSKKFKIYYGKKEDKWVYPHQFDTVDEAWEELRQSMVDFIQKFIDERYDELEDGSLISSMKMFKTKLLYMYFPEKLLPIYSLDHLQKLLKYFDYKDEDIKDYNVVTANMELRKVQLKNDVFSTWDQIKFMRFLYWEKFSEWGNSTERKHEITTDLNDDDIVKKIQSYIKSQGYIYTYEQLSNLILSLKTKPFVILAGISGTGKSKIVRLLADAIGASYNLISVRPDWNDNTELIGYKNLQDVFVKGKLTEVILKAKEEINRPYFVCLDEMNLARVEYYLSDYLSVIESRKKQENSITTDYIIDEDEIKLSIPDNLYLIGTVNMDDTTFQFSRKVLDRANTIEFSDVNLENLFGEDDYEDEGSYQDKNSYQGEYNNQNNDDYEVNYTYQDKERSEHNKETSDMELDNSFLMTNYLKTTDIENCYRNFAKDINKEIIKINEILKKSHRQFAYRVRDEILFYMVENKKSALLDENLAFDYQIMQKILPTISGSDASVSQVLIDLFNYVCDKKVIEDIDVEEGYDYIKVEDIKYKNTAQKILNMLEGYRNDGYCSYWY